MATLPEHVRRAEEARLAETLDVLLPASAPVVRDRDLTAVAWPGVEGSLRCAARVGSAPTRFLDLEGVAAEPEAVARAIRAGARGSHAGTLRVLMGRARRPGADAGGPVPGRLAALLHVAGGLDAAAAMLVDDTGISPNRFASFVESDNRDATAIRELVRRHAWLVHVLPPDHADLRRDGGDPCPDEVATALLVRHAGLGARDAAALVERMRWAPQVWGGYSPVDPSMVVALSRVPPDMFPPPLSEASRTDRRETAGYVAMTSVAGLADAVSRVTGRTFRQVVGKAGLWPAYLDRLAARAGVGVGGDREDGHVARLVRYHLTDLVWSFADQVLAPAIHSLEPSWSQATRLGGSDMVGFASPDTDPVTLGSLRLLMGRGSLQALAETCGRWHSRTHAIAREVAGIRSCVVPEGPRLFDDLDLGDGTYLACLSTAAALLDEGAPGADAQGAPGLDHCVASYSDRVAYGRTAILSLRRRLPCGGFERLSTAEVDFTEDPPRVRQHMGLRNARVDAGLDAALHAALPAVAAPARDALGAHGRREGHVEPVSMTIHRTGSWERMRDLWSFALTRPQRSMGPAGILREAGVDPSSLRPEW